MAASAILSLLSGFLLVLSMPPYSLSAAAFFALIPLLLAVLFARSRLHAFFLSLGCGAFFFVGTFAWVTHVGEFNWVHFVFLLPFFVWHYGVCGLVLHWFAKRLGIVGALCSAPFLWIVFEYVRSHFFFLALPWALVGHTQYQHPMLIQVSAITGVYGVSFLIVAVNSSLTLLAIFCLKAVRIKSIGVPENIPSRINWTIIAIPFFLLASAVLVGQKDLKNTRADRKGFRISVVQPNIPQDLKWEPEQSKSILGTLRRMTLEAAGDKPGLIVWPETSTPGALNQSPMVRKEVASIVGSTETPLLLGSSARSKFRVSDGEGRKYFNSAFLIKDMNNLRRPQGYAKILLLPFGEYLPHEKIIPWASLGAPIIEGYQPGKDIKVFDLHDFKFAATICWENIFPDLVRQFVKNGAQFIVNITNEAWFGETAAPYQFLAMSVFRAVENRVYVVRCANTGISCIIDPWGRVVDRVKDETGRDIFVRGVLTGTVFPMDVRTFYTRFGDVFAGFCFAVSAGFLVAGVFAKKR